MGHPPVRQRMARLLTCLLDFILRSEISGLPRFNAIAKVDNFVVRFSFPYVPPLKIEPGFVPRESAAPTKAEVVDITKATPHPAMPPAQELKPEAANTIAAMQEPHFE